MWFFHDEGSINSYDQRYQTFYLFLGSNGIMNNKADLPASMSITKKYEYLAHLGLVNSPTILPCKKLPKDSLAEMNGTVDKSTSSEPILVAVEVKPQFLESQLPPSVRQKKFGAM